MKVKLRKMKWVKRNFPVREWDTAEPFFTNPTGSLCHRPRQIHTHIRGGKDWHTTMTYYCGNIGRIRVSAKDELVAVPPKGRLLCARCEAMAVAAGELPASKVAGRHVHVGRMIPKRICCNDQKN